MYRPVACISMLRTCSICGGRKPAHMGSKTKPKFVCAECVRAGKVTQVQ